MNHNVQRRIREEEGEREDTKNNISRDTTE
jgi:hypothetical protein